MNTIFATTGRLVDSLFKSVLYVEEPTGLWYTPVLDLVLFVLPQLDLLDNASSCYVVEAIL